MRECALCHGKEGLGGTAESANLQTTLMTVSEVEKTIREGRGDMQPFDYLAEEDVSRIAVFVKELNE